MTNKEPVSLEQLVDDICVYLHGKDRIKELTNEETHCWYLAEANLKIRGFRELVKRGVRYKHAIMKQQLEDFEKICREDNIPLEDE